jgi:predicted nucleotidyltransferase
LENVVASGDWKIAEGVVNNVLLPYGHGEIDSIFVVGSDAHGTKLHPRDGGSDDTDYIAIFMPSADNILGSQPFHHYTYNVDGLDVVVYSFPKLMSMLKSANPNILGLLFYDNPEHVPLFGPVMTNLTALRDMFLSKQLYDRFEGYSRSQIKGMEKSEFKGYMGANRKEVVQEVGYDTKAAAHALRLLWMGIEIFTHGSMCVDRTGIDAGTLKDIKRGAHTLETVMSWIDSARAELQLVYKNTHLPENPDWEGQERFLVDTMLGHLVADYISLSSSRSRDGTEIYGTVSGFNLPGLEDILRHAHDYQNPWSMEMMDFSSLQNGKKSTNIAGGENSTNIGGTQNSADMEGSQNSDELGAGYEYSTEHGVGEKSEGTGWRQLSERLGRALKSSGLTRGYVSAYLERGGTPGGYLDTM